MKNKSLILNPYFILGLILLLANDFFLKQAFGNALTGKLSDFAGLLIFPLFVAFLLPKLKRSIALITGIAFILWKTPLADPFIHFINQWFIFDIHRVVDYTDYIALLILPLSHYLINNPDSRKSVFKNYKLRLAATYILSFIAFFAFCATSIPFREIPKGNIYIGKSYTIKLPKDSIIKTIENMGYNCVFHPKDTTDVTSLDFYQTDNIVRYSIQKKDSTAIDTIANIKYDLKELKPNKTKLTIINVTLSRKGNIQNWKMLREASKEYESWLKQNLIKKID